MGMAHWNKTQALDWISVESYIFSNRPERVLSIPSPGMMWLTHPGELLTKEEYEIYLEWFVPRDALVGIVLHFDPRDESCFRLMTDGHTVALQRRGGDGTVHAVHEDELRTKMPCGIKMRYRYAGNDAIIDVLMMAMNPQAGVVMNRKLLFSQVVGDSSRRGTTGIICERVGKELPLIRCFNVFEKARGL